MKKKPLAQLHIGQIIKKLALEKGISLKTIADLVKYASPNTSNFFSNDDNPFWVCLFSSPPNQ